MAGTLRIGFAMGGGVSLGTFNGAALTQALKLAILRSPYSRIEVDCFSGASAGAMSLAVLLRGLAQQTPEQRAQAAATLAQEFGAEFTSLPEGGTTQQDLIAAQVVQDAQERIWVNEISIDKLLADGSTPQDSLQHTAGLLNRAAVEDIARRAIAFEGEQLDLGGRRLLADRVLFGCALNNLTPILADARREFSGNELFLQALADGMTSGTHREMRVFDLMFTPTPLKALADTEEHPARWYRYRAGDKREDRTGDLRSRKAWSTITATALASGAFPGAFEPVVLTRHSFEFGNLWPSELAAATSHLFTYSDGGSLNNEPIRECFRMASFLDARNKQPGDDRWIVFVDPNVSEPVTPLQLPLHRRWRLDEPNPLGDFDGFDLVQLASLDRLLPFFGSLLGTVLNEARSIEGDKIFKTHRRFRLRDDMRALLLQTLDSQPPPAVLTTLLDFITAQLASNRANLLIPVGGLTAQAELARVIAEEPALQKLQGKEAGFLDNPAAATQRALWLRALAFIAVDLVMDMTGKNKDSQLVAIAPASPLPGGLLSGFGGFMSDLPGSFEVATARHRTRTMLEAAGLITPAPSAEPAPDFTPQWAQYRKDFEARIPLLAKRLTRLLDDSHVPLLAAVPDWILRGIVRKKLEAFAATNFPPQPQRKLNVEFRLQLTSGLKGLEWDGKGLPDRDIAPVTIDGTRTLLTFASYNFDSDQWSGEHVDEANRCLLVDAQARGEFCRVELPTAAQMTAAALLPNPLFVMQLQAAHRKTRVTAACWDPAPAQPGAGLHSGVTPLEELLFR